MSKLTVKELYLFNLKEEKAKHVSFHPGKNVISSSSIDGNNVGKTTILKSIYHTMGADCKFDNMWPSKEMIYVLSVDVDGIEYTFYRNGRLLRVYSDTHLLFETSSRHEYAEFLQKQFGIAVYLPNRQKNELELAPPAYSFVLNYLDNPTGPSFSSFDRLGEYKDVKDKIIYNHLGTFDHRYYNLTRLYEQCAADKNSAEEKLYVLQNMIERIGSEIVETDYSSNMESLQKEISSISRSYSSLVRELSELKRKIVDLSNTKISAERKKIDLEKAHSKLTSGLKALNETRQCPKCKSILDDLVVFRAEGYNQQAALVVMRDELDLQLLELDRRLAQLQEKYRTKLEEVDKYKKKLKKAQSYSDDIIRQEGAVQIRDQFISEADALYFEIEKLKQQIKTLNKDLDEYKERIKELDEKYYPLMRGVVDRFALQEIKDDHIKKLSSSFKASKNNTGVATIGWLYSLLTLKAKYNPDAIVLPILLDSPSYGELDNAKEDALWKFLFDLPTPNAQLIITKLDFTDHLKRLYAVENVIWLDNPKYNLLDGKTYEENLHVLQELQVLTDE